MRTSSWRCSPDGVVAGDCRAVPNAELCGRGPPTGDRPASCTRRASAEIVGQFLGQGCGSSVQPASWSLGLSRRRPGAIRDVVRRVAVGSTDAFDRHGDCPCCCRHRGADSRDACGPDRAGQRPPAGVVSRHGQGRRDCTLAELDLHRDLVDTRRERGDRVPHPRGSSTLTRAVES